MNDNDLQEKIDAIAEDIKSRDKDVKQKAYTDLLELNKLYPSNTSVLDWLGFYYTFELEDFEKARKCYDTILAMEPENELALDGLKTVSDVEKISNKHLDDDNETSEYAFKPFTNFEVNLDFLSAKVMILLKLIIVGTAIYFFFPQIIFGWTDKQIAKIDTWYGRPVDAQILPVNSPQDFNRLTKNEVYAIRKNFVKKSLFANDNYEPNSAVFGGIVDGKPWWGLNQIVCSPYQNKNFDKTKGTSAVSKYINNPNMLIGTMFAFNYPSEYDRIGYCNAQYSKTIPYEMYYLKDKNLITAKYKMDKRILKSYVNWNGKNRPYFLNLTGLNARDLGYKYGYAFMEKNLETTELNSIGSDITEFRDYIHIGSSCGHKEGCNNLSPYQPELDYRIKRLPAQITIKLWKNKPFNKHVKADVYYRLIFEEL